MKKIITSLLILSSTALFAQSTDTTQLKQVVISANKFETPKEQVAQQIQVISQQQLEQQNAMNTADVLTNTGNIVVQKSQGGGGSPIIRGFEANKVLIEVDGIRLNNAIFRGGHLQNVLRVDNAALDHVEVMYGPSSTVYGSDALGGVMSFYTKKAVTNKMGGNAMLRYGTATGEQALHLDFNVGLKKIAFLTSVSYGNYGDVIQGADHQAQNAGFGNRTYYVERINGKDSMIKNSNVLKQVGSAYKQYDIMEKVLFQQGENLSHTLNIQYSNTGDVNRYDRLTEMSGGKLKYAQWYYGPETRLLASYRMDYTKSSALCDKFSVIAAYQKIGESRHSRRFNAANIKHQIEDVSVISLDVDATKRIKNNNVLYYGVEAYLNTVDSKANFEDVTTGATKIADTRYPDGGSTMNTFAAYLQDKITIEENKWYANVGARLTSSMLKSTFNDTTFFNFPFKSVEQNHTALSGTASLVYMASKQTRFTLLGSTGFRSPNVDDMTKVFETGPGNLIVPNPTLQPEYTYNAEISTTHTFGKDGMIEGGMFYTYMDHALVVDKGLYNGKDSVMYGGVMEQVYMTQNKGQALITGFYANARLNVTPHFSLSGNFTKSRGRILTGGIETPLDHIAPLSGRVSADYQKNKFSAAVWVLMNGRKNITEYLLNAEDNEQYATANGMPAWQCVNLRIGYQLHKNVSLQLACENLLDTNYRVFASGISAPGRNFKITVRGTL